MTHAIVAGARSGRNSPGASTLPQYSATAPDVLGRDGEEPGGLGRVGVIAKRIFLCRQIEIEFRREHAAAETERGADLAQRVSDDGDVASVGVNYGDVTKAPRVDLPRNRPEQRAQRFLRNRERAGKTGVLVALAHGNRRSDVTGGVGGQSRERTGEPNLSHERIDRDRQVRAVLLDCTRGDEDGRPRFIGERGDLKRRHRGQVAFAIGGKNVRGGLRAHGWAVGMTPPCASGGRA